MARSWSPSREPVLARPAGAARHEVPGFPGQTPARARGRRARPGCRSPCRCRGDGQAQVLEVVAGVDDEAGRPAPAPGPGRRPAWRRRDPAAQGDHMARRGPLTQEVLRQRPQQFAVRPPSSAASTPPRTRAAGEPSAPRRSPARRPRRSRRPPPTRVTLSSRPNRSRSPRRSRSASCRPSRWRARWCPAPGPAQAVADDHRQANPEPGLQRRPQRATLASGSWGQSSTSATVGSARWRRRRPRSQHVAEAVADDDQASRTRSSRGTPAITQSSTAGSSARAGESSPAAGARRPPAAGRGPRPWRPPSAPPPIRRRRQGRTAGGDGVTDGAGEVVAGGEQRQPGSPHLSPCEAPSWPRPALPVMRMPAWPSL